MNIKEILNSNRIKIVIATSIFIVLILFSFNIFHSKAFFSTKIFPALKSAVSTLTSSASSREKSLFAEFDESVQPSQIGAGATCSPKFQCAQCLGGKNSLNRILSQSPNQRYELQCQAGVYDDMAFLGNEVESIALSLHSQILDKITDCRREAFASGIILDDKIYTETKFDYTCQIKILKTLNERVFRGKMFGKYLLSEQITWHQKHPGDSIPAIFKTETSEAKGTETDKQAINATLTRKTTVETSPFAGNDIYIEVYEEDNMNFKGSIDTDYSADLTTKEDLLQSFENLPDYILDIPNNNFWTLETAGNVKGSIAANWNYTKKPVEGKEPIDTLMDTIKITKLTFCPDGCEIIIKEKANIKARKEENDGLLLFTISADFSSNQKGVGGGDVKTGNVYWASLTINDTSKTKWDYNTKYNNGLIVRQKGLEDTINLSESLIKINDSSNKYSNNVIVQEPPSKYIEENPPITTIADEIISFTGKTNRETGKQKTNTDGMAIRTETQNGRIISVIKIKTDNKGSYVIFPEDMKGQKPPNIYSGIENYLKNELRSIGIFKPQSCNTTIATPKTQLIPKKVILITNFKKGDFAFKASEPLFATFSKWLQKRGSSIQKITARNKKDILNALSSSNGAWVIYRGHGLPTGLATEGEEILRWPEIAEVLSNKNVRLDVLALETCFGGRIPSSVAHQIFGSLGIGRTKSFEGLGCMVGIGNNLELNTSAQSLIRKLTSHMEKQQESFYCRPIEKETPKQEQQSEQQLYQPQQQSQKKQTPQELQEQQQKEINLQLQEGTPQEIIPQQQEQERQQEDIFQPPEAMPLQQQEDIFQFQEEPM